MAFQPGTRIGPYQIQSPLGAGGMGEVYRATDTNLGRQVAIKVLPEAFATDPERLARFEREAKTLASLNYLNIAAIYGLERSGGLTALVMELVEGPTLADRIAQGPIPVDETLPIAKQIAEALEAAHEQGIIHRDLKPANIKLRPDGTVKVLDFGLAKALDPAVTAVGMSHSPTITSPAMMTGLGALLGTAAYMSPEQARGKAVDKRADIWAFGCVLYEILTGRRAFQAETMTEVFASVLAREADFSLLPHNLHPKIVDLVHRCLEKDVRKRWQAAGDLRVELESVLADPGRFDARIARQGQSALRIAALVLAGALVGGIASAVVSSLRETPTQAKITRFSIVLPQDQTFTRPGRHILAVSPDGTTLVYVANNRLYSRRMSELDAQPIPGTEQDVNSPFFSPDGQWVGFFSFRDNTLKKIPLTGGVAVTLCPATNPYGVSWTDNTIIFGQGAGGVLAVSANGGKPEVWASVEPGEVAASPQILPGGHAALFTVTKATGANRWDKSDIVVRSRNSDERKVLIQGGSAARYVSTGHLVYAVGASILAAPFDLQRLEVTGAAIPIVESVARVVGPEVNTAAAQFDFASDGTFAYIPASSLFSAGQQLGLAFINRRGSVEPLDLPPAFYESPRLSPDGKQLVVQTTDDGGQTLWVYDLSGRSSLRRLTFDGNSSNPVWSADGRWIAYNSDREGNQRTFRQAADGTGVAERLSTPGSGEEHFSTSWSRDGRVLLFEFAKQGQFGLAALASDGSGKIEPLVDVPGSSQLNAELSPDGRWFAYISDEREIGTEEVFVEPFPRTGAKYQVSRGHSHAPLWSPDGRELFYYDVGLGRLVALTIQTQPSISFGNPVPLQIDPALLAPSNRRHYDVTSDGQRFLALIPASSTTNGPPSLRRIDIVLSWFEELKRVVPAN